MEHTIVVQMFIEHLSFCSYLKDVTLGVRKLSARKNCKNGKENSISLGIHVRSTWPGGFVIAQVMSS
jgi:hypothetical protein